MRTVIVASPASSRAVKIENFNGQTWGELKTHEQIRPLLNGSIEAILNPGNTTLGREDAVLPTEDFRVYLVPTKNKAGMTKRQSQDLGREIAQAIAQAATNAGEEQVRELKEELIEKIEDFFDVSLSSTNGDEELEEALEHSKSFLHY